MPALFWQGRKGVQMTTHNPIRVVFDEMNRDPGKFYPMETCALAVQFAEALIKAGVIPAPQKEEK